MCALRLSTKVESEADFVLVLVSITCVCFSYWRPVLTLPPPNLTLCQSGAGEFQGPHSLVSGSKCAAARNSRKKEEKVEEE